MNLARVKVRLVGENINVTACLARFCFEERWEVGIIDIGFRTK